MGRNAGWVGSCIDEVRQYEDAIRGVVIQLESPERHPYLAFTVKNRADFELWSLVVPPRGAQDIAEEQRLGHKRAGQVCIRAGGAETDRIPHEQAGVGAIRKDWERQVLCGEVHREADEK